MLKYVTEEYELLKPRDGDVGYDLRSMEEVTIWPGMQHKIRTGICVEIELPKLFDLVNAFLAKFGAKLDLSLIAKDRSSVASKQVYTHAGVMDSGYRGELKILLSNHGNMPHQIRKGDKIAQLLIVPVLTIETERVLMLSDTVRGESGFGSTGV